MAKQLNVNIGVTADTSQAKIALQQLQTQLTQLTSTPANFTLGGSIKKDAVEASKAIAQLQVQLKNATNINTGNLDLTKFNQSMKASNMSLEKYRLALTSMGTAGQQAFAALANSISQAEVPLRRSNSVLKEFGTTIMNTARWQLSSSIIHGIMGSIQGAYNYAQKLNESLNRIQIVTEASDASMARFAEQANKAAKALSTTTTSYTDAALIYYQQGFRDEKDIASRVETTIKMANASGQSAEKVSNQMTAIWNNFAKGSTNLEYYADVITALGAATASSSEEIATGLQKFASVADTVGLSYENATAALATITATTRQSADSVGTGLRTLFARLQSLSLGDTLEDGVTLTKYSKALDQIGVSVLDASGNLRQMDDILADMGAKWDKLNDAQKTAVAQTVGGVRQYTTLMALMENFDTYQQNVNIAKNSEGTVSRQADIYAKSWEAAQKRVKASAQTIYSDLIDDKFFINLNDSFAKFLNQIHNTISAFGGLKGILLGIGTLITTVFADKAATKLQNFAYNIQMLTPKGRQQVQGLREQGANMLVQNAGQGSDFMNQTMSKAYAEQGALQNAYLANAQRMTTEQQNIAQAMMQQQQALIKNVQLQAEAVQNSQKQAKQDEINTKRLVNEATWAGGKVQKDFIKGKVSEVATEARNFGKIDTFLSSFDGKTITNIDQVANSIQKLGLGINEFENYAAGAGQIFQNLKNALADPNMDPATKLATIQQALDQLNTIRGNGDGGAALQTIVNRLKELADGANMSEESVKAFKKTLDDLVASATRAGGAEQNLGAAESQLTGFTKMLAAAMDELAAKQYTTAQAIVNLAGALSSLAMIWTNIKNLTKTWNDDSLSFGDKLASTLTTLGPTLMMASNGLKNFLPSVIKLGQGIGTSIPIISSLNTAITGVAGSAVAAVASFATFAAIAAAIGIGVYALAKSIETTGERLKRLTTNSEDARESAENAKEAYQNLLSLQSQHNDLLESINQLTEGTMEFRDALIQANSVAQELIQIGGLKFGTDWWYNDKGLIELNKDSVARTQEQLLRREEDTAKASAMANALLEGVQNGIAENKAVKQAEKENRYDPNSYTNFMLDPYSHLEEIAEAMGDDVSEEVAYQYATDLANNFMRPLINYRNWLERDHTGSYQDYYDYLQKDHQENYGGEGTQFLSAEGEIYDPDYMASMFSEYMPLFSGATTLEEFMQNVLGERKHFTNLEDSDLRQTNSQLEGVLTQIERDQSSAIGSDVLASLIKEDILKQYSDDDALTKKEDQIRKKINDSDIPIEDQYRTAFHFSKTDKLPSDVLNENGDFDKDKAIEAIKNLELYNDFVQEFMDTREKYMLDNVSQYDDFLSQNTAGVQNYISQLDQEAKENPDKYFSASRLSDYMIKQVQKSYDNAWGALLDTNIDTDDETTKAVVDSLSSAQRDTFADIIKTNSSTFGKDSATILAQSILNNPRLLNDVSRLGLTGQKVKDLKKVQDSDLEFKDELYQSMLKGAGGRKGLLEELYESEDFNKNLKTLQKTFEKTGQIGADAITKIADSSEEFADLLDISGINAATLADVLEAIEIGDVSGIESLSEELINAFTAASGLQQTLAEVFQYIDNFQQVRSTTDIGKFYKGLTGNVENGWQAGLTSDPALLQAWGEMFGQQSMNEYLSALINLQNDKNLTPDQINAQLESRFGNEIAAMQSIQENNNISGLFDYYAKKSPGAGMFRYNNQTGQVEAVNEDILRQNQWDTEQGFIQGLIDNYNIDENLAKAMAAEYSSANAFVGNLWQQSNVNAGIEALIGKPASGAANFAQYNKTESGMTTVSDLEAFYRQYSTVIDDIYDIDKNLDYDSRMAQFVEQAGNAAKANGQQLISLGKDFSFVGKGIGDIDSALQKESQTNLKDFLKNFTGKDAEQQTIQDLVKAFKSLGATSSQALDLANEQINNTYGNLEKYNEAVGRTNDQWEEYRQWCKDHGRETDLSSYMDWEDTLADAEKMQEQAKLVAESISNAFKDIFSGMEFIIDDETHTISIKFKTEGEEEVKQVAEEAEKPKDTDVTIQPNTELYDQVMKDVLSNKVVKVFLEYANGNGSGEVGSNSDGSYNTSTSGLGGAGGTPPSQRESQPGPAALPGTTASTDIPAQNYLSMVGQYADWAIGRVGSDFKGGQTLNRGLWSEFVGANGGDQSGLPDWRSLTQGLAGTGIGDQLLSSNHIEAAAALSHVNDFAPQIELTSDSISELSSAIGEEQNKKDTGENVQKRFGNKTVSGEDNQQGKTDTREEDKPQINQEKLKAMARGIIEAQQEGRNPSDNREEKPMPTPQKESSKPDTSGEVTGKSSKDTKIKAVAEITKADSKAIEPIKIKAEADLTGNGKQKKEEPIEVPVEVNEDQIDSLSEKEVSMPVDLDPNTDKVASYIAEGAQKVVDLNTGNNQPAKDIAALPGSHTLDIAVNVSISASNSFGSSISAAGGAGFLSSAVGGIIQDLAKSEATNHPAVQQLIQDTKLHMECRGYNAANAKCKQTQGWTGTQGKASGGLIGSHASGGLFRSYVNGSANRYGKPGLSLTAEEGPEIIWNKMGGYAYIVGGEGHPEFAYLQPGDRIFNANDTRQILNYHRPQSNENSPVRDPRDMGDALFGSHSVGYAPGPSIKSGKTKGGKGGGGGSSKNDAEFKPERYHLITRQIADLTFIYEELQKAKEHAYGTNVLNSINKEIDATNQLIEANKQLLEEAEEYLELDKNKLIELEIPAEFDEYGNLKNFKELEELYKKVIDTSENEEEKKNAQKRWDAITQYEETLDKIKEVRSEITDKIYELADLKLEQIQVKAEIKVDFDDRETKYIQHFIDKINDNLYKTSDVLKLLGSQIVLITHKINTAKQGIDDIFANMTDKNGNKINITYEQWLKMSDAEREALDINGKYGKQLEQFADDILNYIEALEEYKMKGVEEVSAAFDELNDKVNSQIDLFSHYSTMLSSLRDIADLQGLKLPEGFRQSINKLNQSMIQVTKDSIQSYKNDYIGLQKLANDTQNKINETTDESLKKAYQEDLDKIEAEMRSNVENVLQLWQEGLSKARDIFDQEMQWIQEDYEATFSELYNTADLLQSAFERKKEINDEYVDDYEKYYQLGKLQRSINKDLDNAAINGNKQNKNLKALLEEIQKLQKDGTELSAYDLDILAKKYEYEKALADLEDARTAKQTVRLSRDRNGNWGYVYTAADGDELAEQEQAVEDKLYEYTKAATEQSANLQSEILKLWSEAGQKIAEMRAAGVSEDVIDDFIADTQTKLDFLMSQLEKTGTDLTFALPKWVKLTNESFDLIGDNFTDTILSLVTGMQTITDTGDTVMDAILTIANATKEAAEAYNNSIGALNFLVQGNSTGFNEAAESWAKAIVETSAKNVENTKLAVNEMVSMYDQILIKAKEFEEEFEKKYAPIIEQNEKFLADLLNALGVLNGLPNNSTILTDANKTPTNPSMAPQPIDYTTGPYTGVWDLNGQLTFAHDSLDVQSLLHAANILNILDLQTGALEKGLGQLIDPIVKETSQTLEQEIYITAEFPNAVHHSEIEEAFNNLANRATQYANRKVG